MTYMIGLELEKISVELRHFIKRKYRVQIYRTTSWWNAL